MPATTPVRALPYPVPNDSVDVPRDIQALAEALDGSAYFYSGTHAARPAANTVPAGSRYFATDTWMEWVAITNAWVLVNAEPQPWTSTTLPAAPVDGQRVTFDAGVGARFLLRYNAGSVSAYKWEAEGAGTMYGQSTGQMPNMTPAGFAWSDLAGTPLLVMPFAGEYLFEVFVGWGSPAATGIADVRFKPSAQVGQNLPAASWVPDQFRPAHGSNATAQVATAGQMVGIQFASAVGSGYFDSYDRMLTARPLRVT